MLYRMNVIFCCPRRLQRWTSCAKLRFVSMDTGLRERRTSGQLGLRRPGPLRTQIHSSMIPRHCKLPVVSQRSPGMYMQSNLSIHQSTCSPRLMLRNIPVAHLLVNCSMGPRTSNSTPLQVTFNREALLADFDAGSPDSSIHRSFVRWRFMAVLTEIMGSPAELHHTLGVPCTLQIRLAARPLALNSCRLCTLEINCRFYRRSSPYKAGVSKTSKNHCSCVPFFSRAFSCLNMCKCV